MYIPFVYSPPPKPEVILTNFFAEPIVLLVPITSRDIFDIKCGEIYFENAQAVKINVCNK